jgi:hypothetical protein
MYPGRFDNPPVRMPLPDVKLCETMCAMHPYCHCSEWVAAYRNEGRKIEGPKPRPPYPTTAERP